MWLYNSILCCNSLRLYWYFDGLCVHKKYHFGNTFGIRSFFVLICSVQSYRSIFNDDLGFLWYHNSDGKVEVGDKACKQSLASVLYMKCFVWTANKLFHWITKAEYIHSCFSSYIYFNICKFNWHVRMSVVTYAEILVRVACASGSWIHILKL